MRLLKITMMDFRGYYGHHEVELAAEDQKRVTIFHGENGAGKTNLLNAIHWCIAGKFTPGFQDAKLLVNKEGVKEGRRECFVEILFQDDGQTENKQYRVRRVATNDRQISFQVYETKGGNDTPIDLGESFVQTLLPPGLISWFFFDAETIGSLELSGSDEFKRGLRKTLGFELIDKIIQDLEQIQAKLRRDVASQSNDRHLNNLQEEMNRIEVILPNQVTALESIQDQIKNVRIAKERVRERLTKLPQAEPLERQRASAENRKKRLMAEHDSCAAKSALLIGRAGPSQILHALTTKLEGKLEDQEVKGLLPAPYSDQLVKDILNQQLCICGRPVTEESHEAHKIRELLEFASTGALNHSISDLRYLIRDIEREYRDFSMSIAELRNQILMLDRDIAKCEEEIKEVEKALQGINLSEIKELESERLKLDIEFASLHKEEGRLAAFVETNTSKHKDLKRQHETAAKKIVTGMQVKKEQDKVVRLTDFIRNSLASQEKRALTILASELNRVLKLCLTKHYKAKIDLKNYAIKLVDEFDASVGHGAGEGQVLKYAFIATVVALAARKTQEKIEWLTEPTIAPLVLDAPFSVLDPTYQGSVAKNLALQTRQLVLMVNSAAWGAKVSDALDAFVGKRYLIISHESGPQGDKPVKEIELQGTNYLLNYYDAQRTESTLKEIKA
jgi:DNA sulfur modification protein DndD